MIVVAVPSIANEYDPLTPEIAVGDAFVTVAIKYHPTPLQIYNLFVATTKAVFPGVEPEAGKSSKVAYEYDPGAELALFGKLADSVAYLLQSITSKLKNDRKNL